MGSTHLLRMKGFRQVSIFITMFLLVGVLSGSLSYAQNFSTPKDLVLGQVATSGGYKTIVTVTNCGTRTSFGTLDLFRVKVNCGTYFDPSPSMECCGPVKLRIPENGRAKQ
jgi:hypothetical protein